MFEGVSPRPEGVRAQRREDSGKNKALIIAVSEYDKRSQLNQLPFCKNDGEAIYKILKDQYEIPDKWRLIGNVGGQRIKDAIYDFFRVSAKEQDTLFFYFSGHGVHDSYGDTFLASSNIDKKYIDKNGYNFSYLENEAIRKTPARNVIVALDCCLAGAVDLGKSGEDEATKARGNIEKIFKEGSGKCILASSLDGQLSYPMKGSEYSLFTYYLLEGLKGAGGMAVDENGYVTPSRLSNYVYNAIPLVTQKPITKIALCGEIVILSYPEWAKPSEEDEKSFDYLYQLIRDGFIDQFNLARKDFVDLSGRDFQRRNLQNIDLSKSNLRGANMREADLQGADFSNSNLADALFDFADLRAAKFKGANVGGASFAYSNLSKAAIQKPTLNDPTFIGADFSELPIHLYAKNSVNIFDTTAVPSKIIGVDGYEIRYLSYENPIHGGPDTETTILLHGLVGSADGWLLMTPSLSKYLKLVIPDILGFGYSDKPALKYDLDLFMKFLSGFLASLSIRKANIVAMSFGARLAIEFAIRFPSMVNKLVLCSPAIIPPHFDCTSYAKFVTNLNYKDFFRTFVDDHYYNTDLDAGKVAETSARVFADMIRQPGLQHSYESALCELQRYPKLSGRLSKISAPTLVVWGVNDKISHIENADQFREISNSEYVAIKECGHYVCLQKPIEFNKAILNFFLARP